MWCQLADTDTIVTVNVMPASWHWHNCYSKCDVSWLTLTQLLLSMWCQLADTDTIVTLNVMSAGWHTIMFWPLRVPWDVQSFPDYRWNPSSLPLWQEPITTRPHILCPWQRNFYPHTINHLTPNNPYTGRTAPLTSKRCILYIYSTNIGTEYFKHSIYSPFFFLFKMQFVS